MEVMILDRFSGIGNPEGWLYRAELYFAYLGFAEEYWLPLPSFYLDGEALIWFDWLFRNKQFFDWMDFKEKLIQRFSHQNKVYPVVRTTVPSNFEMLFAFKSAYETQTPKEDQVFDKLPEKYHTVDSCEFSNRGITSVTTLDDIVTPLNGKSKSTEVAALVHEPSVMTKDPVFDAMSYKTASPDFHDPNASVLDAVQSALVIAKVTDKSICGNESLHPEATIQVLHECSHNIKLRSIAPQVSLLVPFDGPEVVRSNEHLEQDMSTRYLADFFMEPVGDENLYLNISTSSMHFVKILPDTENGRSTGAFNDQNILSQFLLVHASNLFIVTIPMIATDLCVWDPGICFDFMSLVRTQRYYYCWDVQEIFS